MKWNERLFFALGLTDLTKAQLARAVGVAPAAVSQWENGDTKSLEAKNCFLVCETLGIRQQWLLFGEEPMRRGTNKSIQGVLTLLESLTEIELEKAINILQTVFGKPPINAASKSHAPLAPEAVEAKYFSFNKTEKENEKNLKTCTHNRKKENRS